MADTNDRYHAGHDENFQKFWAKTIAQAWGDNDLYQKLVTEPNDTIHQLAKEYQGWDLSDYISGYTFAVNEYVGQASDVKMLVAILPLPPKPESSGNVTALAAGCCSSSSTCCC